MITSIIATALFIAGLLIGLVALLEPLTGLLVIIYRYLQKLLKGPGPFSEPLTTSKSTPVKNKK